MHEVLSERIRSLMQKKGFTKLTEIQERAMGPVARGENVLIIAPTGWGKTEAAVLPLLDKLARKDEQTKLKTDEEKMEEKNEKENINMLEKERTKMLEISSGIKVLYITPLRALNRDMLSRVTWWCEQLGVSIAVRHGDTLQSERQKQARKPPEILITTPETLQALLPAKRIGKALLNVETVVVDEVHELFDSKRGAQLSVALERLVEKKGEFQRIGLSATVGAPQEVAEFLFAGRKHRVEQVSAERQMKLSVEAPEKGAGDAKLAEDVALDEQSVARLRRLDELVSEHRASLIFVNTRHVAEVLTSRLLVMHHKLGSAKNIFSVHHGSLAKEERVRVEESFKKGEIKGLVSTSSLELGMDIGEVDLVVQYMSPRQVSRLVQRVGRSGHSFERTPKGIVMCSDADDVLEAVAVCEAALSGKLEKPKMQSNALDVLAHQIAGIALEWGEIRTEKAFEIVRRAAPYAKLTREEFEAVARQLHSQRLLWFEGGIRRGSNTLEYYYGNLSMIPSARKFGLRNAATNRLVANLDEVFVSTLEKGVTFISKGIPWRVLDVSEEEVVVEPSESFTAAVPDWVGEEIPVPFEIAKGVGELRRKAKEGRLESEVLRKDAEKLAVETLAQQLIVPDEKTIFIEVCADRAVIHVCGGSEINDTLAKAVSAALSASLGQSVRADSDPYRISLLLPVQIRAKKIAAVVGGLSVIRGIIEKSIERSPLFRYKFIHAARAFGLISDKVTVGKRVMEHLRESPIWREAMREITENYLDVEGCEKLLGEIRGGRIRIVAEDVDGFSKLGMSAMMRVSAGELISPVMPSSEVLKAFEGQILEKNMRFVCTYCKSLFYEKIGRLGRKIDCPKCKSPLVAPARDGEEKLIGKEGLKAEEKRKINELMKKASLIEAYGRRGAIALAVYGVGAETAARVLSNVRRNEDAMFIDLLEAQKNFIKTKRYWKVG
ncbi:MAG: DEAD/DEAH box helicase [Candidatus Micrarchaeota archaeon]|nr:DEAD/DEAH box helicase [Candidatus Micrarchaeota archaeon]